MSIMIGALRVTCSLSRTPPRAAIQNHIPPSVGTGLLTCPFPSHTPIPLSLRDIPLLARGTKRNARTPPPCAIKIPVGVTRTGRIFIPTASSQTAHPAPRQHPSMKPLRFSSKEYHAHGSAQPAQILFRREYRYAPVHPPLGHSSING